MIELLDPGERVVILIDDAQDLTDERLEDLRLLSNIDASGSKRLHFVLIGQPELLTRLRQSALRNVNQRIGARATLNPLSRHQAREHVDYRLRQKGGSAERTFCCATVRCSVRIAKALVMWHLAMRAPPSPNTLTRAVLCVPALVVSHQPKSAFVWQN
jgi:AAA domain